MIVVGTGIYVLANSALGVALVITVSRKPRLLEWG
jgi:hypothetical protein